MVFITAGSCRTQLESLTQLLVSTFQGVTIYRHTDPFRLLHDVLYNKVDAVFLEANEKDNANNQEFMQMLRKQKPEIPVFIVSNTEDFREEAAVVGASDYLIQPIGEQRLWDAMQRAKSQKIIE